MRPSPAARGRLLRVATSLVIVGALLATVDLSGLARVALGVRLPYLAVGLAIYLLGQVLSAWKWRLLGRAVGLERTPGEYVRFYFIGMFFNLFGPSTLGGDVVRGLYLGGGRRAALALVTVVFDRASGLVLLLALGAAALVLGSGYELPRPLVVVCVAGGAALALGWWACPVLVRLLPAGHRLRRRVEGDLAPFWRDPTLLAGVAVLSLVFHLTQVLVQYVLARAAGAPVPFGYCLVYHPIISVLTALPVSIGGLGVREGGYLYFLTHIGVPAPTAVTISVLWLVVTVLGALPGGAAFLAAGARLPRPEGVAPEDAAA